MQKSSCGHETKALCDVALENGDTAVQWGKKQFFLRVENLQLWFLTSGISGSTFLFVFHKSKNARSPSYLLNKMVKLLNLNELWVLQNKCLHTYIKTAFSPILATSWIAVLNVLKGSRSKFGFCLKLTCFGATDWELKVGLTQSDTTESSKKTNILTEKE